MTAAAARATGYGRNGNDKFFNACEAIEEFWRKLGNTLTAEEDERRQDLRGQRMQSASTRTWFSMFPRCSMQASAVVMSRAVAQTKHSAMPMQQ